MSTQIAGKVIRIGGSLNTRYTVEHLTHEVHLMLEVSPDEAVVLYRFTQPDSLPSARALSLTQPGDQVAFELVPGANNTRYCTIFENLSLPSYTEAKF